MKLLLTVIYMIKLSDEQLVDISFSPPHSPSLTLFTTELFVISKFSLFFILVECSSCHRVNRPEDCNMTTVCDPDEVRICQNTCNPDLFENVTLIPGCPFRNATNLKLDPQMERMLIILAVFIRR